MAFPPDLPAFVSDLHTSQCVVASDGSLRDLTGSFAWIIHGTRSRLHLTGSNITAPTTNDLSTLRTETCGHLGALYALQAILTFYPSLPKYRLQATTHIDNKSVAARIGQTDTYLRSYLKLFHEANTVLSQLPLDLKAQHVESHQVASGIPLAHLPLSACLNIHANESASQLPSIFNPQDSHTLPSPPLPSTYASLSINGRCITSNLTDTIKLYYYTPKLKSQFMEKLGWSSKAFNSID